MRGWITTALMVALFAGNGPSAMAQSIDCGKANSRDEQAVCADPYLRKLDAIKADLHADLEQFLQARRQQDRGWAEHWGTRLFENERGFAFSRAECGEDVSCLEKTYENHNLNLMRMWRDILR